MSEIPLLETDRKVSTIARDVGFSTTSYYNKYFIKWFGHSPQMHRQLHAAHILSPNVPARFNLLSENDAISLLRTRLSALKDQDNSNSAVRHLLYRVELSAKTISIRKNHPVPEVIVTHEDYFALGEHLFSLLDDLCAVKVALAISADNSETTTALIQNRLRIIRTLRCANYSLSAILRMLNSYDTRQGTDADIFALLNTPEEGEDIISACDKLAVSLEAAIANAQDVIRILKEMKKINPPL